ncbi:MAG TPA: permease [Oscillospiraceae bacterium]|nr:permease [Oscillospiraceae bacterium]
MKSQTMLLGSLALLLFIIGLRRKDGSHKKGLQLGAKVFYSYLPVLVLAFFLAGLLQVALPTTLVRNWLGAESGWRGIFVGAFSGWLFATGPYAVFPIIASMMHSGASIGTVIALSTSWALLSLSKLPYELAILGPRFTLTLKIVTFLMPLLAGFLAQVLFGSVVII